MIELQRKARKRLLQMHYEAGAGHIGGNLSCLDALLTLHHRVMRPDDQFVLSKGHAAGALYITHWTKGWLTDDELKTFHKSDGLLGHPESGAHVPFATGSLGHGLSLAVGLALGHKLLGEDRTVYVLMGDGEFQEGSCWEALNFLADNPLPRLKILIDGNGFQGFRAVPPGLKDRLRGFVNVRSVDGHSPEQIAEALHTDFWWSFVNVRSVDGHSPEQIAEALHTDFWWSDSRTMQLNSPQIVWLNTLKGKGVSFLENRFDSHYLYLTEELYKKALAEQ